MSGITGIIGPSIEHPDSASHVATMAHEVKQSSSEPMFDGTVLDEALSARVAWIRREYEPECVAWNDRGDIGLVFVGDDFDLDAKSAFLPHNGRTNTPSQRLIALYERFGPDFVAAINGCFTGLLIDRREETVTLFNDRYGLNRVYYHANSGGFFFSSSARSLLALLPELRQIDQRGLAEFFSLGCVLQNRTLFDGISLLPAGTLCRFHRDGSRKMRRYFDCSTWEQQTPLSPEEYQDRLTDVFKRIAPRYSKDDRNIAMSLTGGLDSRLILAWAGASPGSLPCYTFNGPYRDCADVRIARQLARIAGQPHTTIQIDLDFFRDFPALARRSVHLSDGTMDVSGAVEVYVNQRAKSIAPIRLTGNYGSEVLRSNVAFRPRSLDTSQFTPQFKQFLELAEDTYRHEATGNRLSFIAFKQMPWHHYGRFSIEKSQLTPRSPYLDNELVCLAYRCPQELQFSSVPVLHSVVQGNSALESVETDRALRRHTVPVFGQLSTFWQEFTAKAEYAYDYGMPRWLARTDSRLKLLHLERVFLGRHKFYHFRVWYRDRLAHALRDHVVFNDQPSCYIQGMAKKLVEEHTSGRVNRTLELHQLFTVQLINRLLITP